LKKINERHHKKTVTVGNIRALQTYKKTRSEYGVPRTQILFVYKDRFEVDINSINMNIEGNMETN